MNKTRIEWTDFSWNPITGCLNNCSYCYARRIAERFKGTKAWPDGFEPTFRFDRLAEPFMVGVPSKIFVCSMGELFGDWCVDDGGWWANRVLNVVQHCPEHTFQFLTKCPENLSRWNPWPDNAWVGATVTGSGFAPAWRNLAFVDAPVKFISFEPLLAEVSMLDLIGDEDYLKMLKGTDISWVIIGAQTNPYVPPEKAWVQEIIDAADQSEVPIFLKDNLNWPECRREFPKQPKDSVEGLNQESARLVTGD